MTTSRLGVIDRRMAIGGAFAGAAGLFCRAARARCIAARHGWRRVGAVRAGRRTSRFSRRGSFLPRTRWLSSAASSGLMTRLGSR